MQFLADMREKIRESIHEFLTSSDVEVQERAALTLKVLQLHEELKQAGIDIGPQIKSLFEEELNPVAPGSQKKVPLPEGLDLDVWINDPEEFKDEDEKDDFHHDTHSYSGKSMQGIGSNTSKYILPKGKNDISVVTKDLSELGISDKPKVSGKKGTGLKKKPKKPKEPEVIEKYEISSAVEKPEGYDETKVVKAAIKDKLSGVEFTITNDKELPKVKEYKNAALEKKVVEEPKKDEKVVKKKNTKNGDLLSFDEPKKDVVSTVVEKVEPVKKETKTRTPKKEEKVVEKKVTKTKRKKIAHDETMIVSQAPKVTPHDSTHLDIPIHLENTGTMNITSVEYNISSTVNLQLSGKSGNVPTGFQLYVGKSGDFIIPLTFKQVDKAYLLHGNILYTIDKKGTPEKKTLPFKIRLPVSTFFVPKTIAQETLSGLIKNGEIAVSAIKKIRVNEKVPDFPSVIKEITTHLNVTVIGTSQTQAFLYGASVQGHHLAVILLCKDGVEITLEIRSASDSITTDILNEVIHMFKVPEKK
jgi:AP-3 complex subunit delta-1